MLFLFLSSDSCHKKMLLESVNIPLSNYRFMITVNKTLILIEVTSGHNILKLTNIQTNGLVLNCRKKQLSFDNKLSY